MSSDLPSGLSIREQQVFQLAREGRVDSEIAVRLGIGAGDVKQTIAVLISKCDVADRAGLVAWRPPEPAPRRPALLDRFADRIGPTVGGLALIVVVASALAILTWRALSGDGEPADLSGILASPSIAPSTSPADQFKPLTYTAPEPFPAHTVMWVARGCSLCAVNGVPGDPFAIDRLQRAGPNDPIERRTVYAPPELPQYVRSYAARSDGSEIVIAVCESGPCLTGGGDANSVTRLYSSTDGGDTWVVGNAFEPAVDVLGLGPDGLFVTRRSGESGLAAWRPESGSLYFPPAEASRDARPIVLEGDAYWRNQHRTALLATDGTVLAEVPDGFTGVLGSVVLGSANLAFVSENIRRVAQEEVVSVVVFTNLISRKTMSYRGGAIFLTLAAQRPGPHIATVQTPNPIEGPSCCVRWVPAFVSAINGTVSPIGEIFFEPPYRNNGTVRVIAMRR